MALPRLRYELGLGSNPFTIPTLITWTNITRYVEPGWRASRGNARYLEASRTGDLDLPLDNRTGAFDPGNTVSVFAPYIVEWTPVRIVATLSGIDIPVWYGYVKRWPNAWEKSRGRRGTANLYAIDAIGFLNQTDLPSPLDAAIQADSPLWYYPLSEDVGARSAGDLISASSPPLVVANSKYGASTLTFGADLGVLGGTGVTFDSPNAGTNTNGQMSVLLSKPGRGGPTMAPVAAGFTSEIWLRPSSTKPTTLACPWGQFSEDGNVYLAWFIDSNGLAYFAIGSSAGVTATTTTSPVSICDDRPHQLFAAVSDDGLAIDFVVDGVEVGLTVVTSTPSNRSALSRHVVGGQLLASGGSFKGFKGSVESVAMFPGQVSVARAAAHYTAGALAYAGELNSTRQNRILDLVGWPAALRDIQTSLGTAGPLQAGSTGQALLATSQAELGRLYVRGDGKITSRSRAALYTQATPTIVLGEDDSNGEIPYEPGVVVDYDTDAVVNVATGSRPGGASVTVRDPARVTTTSASVELNVGSDRELVDLLNYIVQQRSRPQQRLGQATVQGATKSLTTWSTLLALTPGTRIRFKRRPPPVLVGGVQITPPVVTVDCFLETLAWDSDLPNRLDLSSEFSPLPCLSYWVLGDPVYGVLDSTTRLGA